MRVRRARTSWETSLMILALSLGESVVNHFASRWRTCQPATQRPEGEAVKTNHLALAREEDEVSAGCQATFSGRERRGWHTGWPCGRGWGAGVVM